MGTCNLWFGTDQHAEFIETPLSGADSSPEGWRATGTLLNGGGYGEVSAANHRTYNYEWRRSSSRQAAQKLQAFRQGAYGHGPFYFVDPLIYDTNVLPAQWSTFTGSSGSVSEGPLPGATRSLVRRTGYEKLGLPRYSTRFVSTSASQGIQRKVYIPIPEGYELYLGAFFEASRYRINVRAQDYNYEWSSGLGSQSVISSLDPNADKIINTSVAYRGRGIELSLVQASDPFLGLPPCLSATGKPAVAGTACAWNASKGGWGNGQSFTTTNSGSTKRFVVFSGENKPAPVLKSGDTKLNYNAWIDLWALTARLVKIGTSPEKYAHGPWIMGQGHSGVVFESEPTYVEYNGVNGGQVGYAATFREVGSWQ